MFITVSQAKTRHKKSPSFFFVCFTTYRLYFTYRVPGYYNFLALTQVTKDKARTLPLPRSPAEDPEDTAKRLLCHDATGQARPRTKGVGASRWQARQRHGTGTKHARGQDRPGFCPPQAQPRQRDARAIPQRSGVFYTLN